MLDRIVERPRPIKHLSLVTGLKTVLHPGPDIPEDWLVRILEKIPALESLAYESVDASRHGHLGKALANHWKLRKLTSRFGSIIDTNWTQLPWQSSLTSLTLGDCEKITPADIDALIAKHGATLHRLSLTKILKYTVDEVVTGYGRMCCPDGMEAAEPYHLPQLRYLNLYKLSCFPNWFERFSQCPRLGRAEGLWSVL